MKDSLTIGHKMYEWAGTMFPWPRSLTGAGVRRTLGFLSDLVPGLATESIPSGTSVFDWTVPPEWNIEEAYIEDERGDRVVDMRNNNLHIVGYSEPVDEWMTLEELLPHLHFIPAQPNAIPYVTSYYERRWGFCLTQQHLSSLASGRYHVVVRSTLEPGELNYGEIVVPGRTREEILLSTYICHPSMANNELSGPVVVAALARWILAMKDRRYTYRIVFVPETIGAICYLSKHIETMKRVTCAGFVVTCVGDGGDFTYLPSRLGGTLADRVARHVLGHSTETFKEYSFLDRGSDERQYCAPGVDLPVCSIMRSKYGTYPEYHTSLDDMSFISPEGLEGSFDVYRRCIEVLERNYAWSGTTMCEPQLGSRGLYPTLGTKDRAAQARLLMDVLAYATDSSDLISLADRIGVPAWKCYEAVEKLVGEGLLVPEGIE